MEYYDTVIIGAGLAGCTLGNLLLSKNKSVIIIENQDLNKKNKLCGGIVTAKAYKLLLKIYKENLSKIKFKHFNYVKVNNEGVIKEIKNQNIYTIFRKDLDDFVVSEFIKNGGKIIDNTNYDKIDFKNKVIYIANKSFKYKNLVAADGVFSKVRNSLMHKNQRMNFAIESEGTKKDKTIQINYIDHFKGYAWSIPNNKTNVIGIGNVDKKTDLKNTFLDYFHLEDNNSIRGAFLPTGDNILLKRGNTFFIGDAAGLASPVSGEGIYFAISSAYNLAKSMSGFYKVRMLKNRFILFTHKISKTFIFNTRIRNHFYKYYGKSKIVTFLVNLVLKTLI